MSSQTPNINLTLPTGAENVSRQIINDNNTKIDTAIGTLNSKLTKPSNISYGDIIGTSLQQIETALTSATVGMATGDVKCYSCYANYSGSITSGSQGIAFLYKVTTSVWYVFIVSIAGVKVGYMANNTWNWL